MASNIKKSLLVTLDFPPNLGGVAAYYYQVCKNLPANKIVVLAPKQEGDQAFDREQNFTIIRKKLLNYFPQKMPKGLGGILKIAASVKWLSIIKHLSPIVKNHKIELIQAGQVLPLGTLALFYQRRRKLPYIFYAHGLDLTLPQKFMRKKTLLKKIIAGAAAIVANSYFTKDELLKLGATPEKIKVIYPCPNLPAQPASDQKIKEISANHHLTDKKILLTVGRLIERKGHDSVIKALPAIIKKVPTVVYLIVGSGPEEKRLKKLVNQHRLGDYVKFLGAVSPHDLVAFYQLCDVFIMPARQLANGDVEGFGIVYLEANQFAKPVIGGRSGGVAEAVIDGQTGILVDPIDVNEIAQAAIKLLTDTAYAAKLGTQGLERVTEKFDWPTQVEKIKEILEKRN